VNLLVGGAKIQVVDIDKELEWDHVHFPADVEEFLGLLDDVVVVGLAMISLLSLRPGLIPGLGPDFPHGEDGERLCTLEEAPLGVDRLEGWGGWFRCPGATLLCRRLLLLLRPGGGAT